jgi:hypothetical protein
MLGGSNRKARVVEYESRFFPFGVQLEARD